ncbi:peptidoglycan-binding protein [Streptomyces caniscabiei]|uniref:Peptidoglycan-binding protein n=1 Tax=Streptomyces caniscabiei TaxID=2746961 RepID=A0ABU4N4M5_9ACTN|nr:peptidoglycan-binding protein [Streptomyces caniscabiei]MBE4741140.1 peptidoglycan-binding protein [Streptomyces caniscabiei]MBE4760791.1 peptidoglycan-binding protein [Streptomyces caniscabiei]MBE4774775.1 peptidoglycan-binding protein [Streptomyces caniscabiei]MBE4789533.1 peptidoglycan-binding protein [Streptomyces caniscabiei]MBE4798798.1 peptidoglycan-binding protein [Streptomyces caniscabiei]
MSLPELRALAAEAGFTGDDIKIAAAVAMAESKGYAGAVGDQHLVDNKWGPSIGLFQIRSLKHPGQFSPPDTLRIEGKLKNPLYNAKTAKAIKHAHNWKQWSTFVNGAYKQYMDGGPASPSHFEPFPSASFFHAGRKSPIVAAMHQRLVAEDCNRYQSSAGADTWGPGDVKSYAAWQQKIGFAGDDANGIPGKTSWDKLRVPNV